MNRRIEQIPGEVHRTKMKIIDIADDEHSLLLPPTLRQSWVCSKAAHRSKLLHSLPLYWDQGSLDCGVLMCSTPHHEGECACHWKCSQMRCIHHHMAWQLHQWKKQGTIEGRGWEATSSKFQGWSSKAKCFINTARATLERDCKSRVQAAPPGALLELFLAIFMSSGFPNKEDD